MTEQQFKRAKFLDNEIKHLKNIKRNIELPRFSESKATAIEIHFEDNNRIYLNEAFIKKMFGLCGVQAELKKFLNEEIPLLEAEFKKLVSNE